MTAAEGDAAAWLLVNASPDVRVQLQAFAALWPRCAPGRARDTPVADVVLTNGDLDHVLGLLSMRESQPLHVLATRRVRSGLVDRNAFFRTLARRADQLTWTELELGVEVPLPRVGVAVTAVAAPGKLPVHLVGLVEPSPEDNVALRVRDLRSGATLVIATAVGALDGVERIVAGADALFFDGTFWSEGELQAPGLGGAAAREMAHIPIGGPTGSLAALTGRVDARRKVYTHLNNTNPIVFRNSAERAAVDRAGWEVASDGMEIAL